MKKEDLLHDRYKPIRSFLVQAESEDFHTKRLGLHRAMDKTSLQQEGNADSTSIPEAPQTSRSQFIIGDEPIDPLKCTVCMGELPENGKSAISLGLKHLDFNVVLCEPPIFYSCSPRCKRFFAKRSMGTLKGAKVKEKMFRAMEGRLQTRLRKGDSAAIVNGSFIPYRNVPAGEVVVEGFKELSSNVVEVQVRYAIEGRKVTVAPSELEPRGAALERIRLQDFTNSVSPLKGRVGTRRNMTVIFIAIPQSECLCVEKKICVHFASCYHFHAGGMLNPAF
jgi:hypothetical protein